MGDDLLEEAIALVACGDLCADVEDFVTQVEDFVTQFDDPVGFGDEVVVLGHC